MADEAAIRPNVIVLKSLGKNFGLHGIRFGYMVANPALAYTVRRMLPKWNLNSFAESVVFMLKEHMREYQESLRLLAADRLSMYQQLSALPGLTVYPSQGNFLMIKLPHGKDGKALRDYLYSAHNIFVRECGNKLGSSSQFLRLVVRPRQDAQRLVDGLHAYLFSAGNGRAAAAFSSSNGRATAAISAPPSYQQDSYATTQPQSSSYVERSSYAPAAQAAYLTDAAPTSSAYQADGYVLPPASSRDAYSGSSSPSRDAYSGSSSTRDSYSGSSPSRDAYSGSSSPARDAYTGSSSTRDSYSGSSSPSRDSYSGSSSTRESYSGSSPSRDSYSGSSSTRDSYSGSSSPSRDSYSGSSSTRDLYPGSSPSQRGAYSGSSSSSPLDSYGTTASYQRDAQAASPSYPTSTDPFVIGREDPRHGRLDPLNSPASEWTFDNNTAPFSAVTDHGRDYGNGRS